jgi:hypothetical protein
VPEMDTRAELAAYDRPLFTLLERVCRGAVLNN